jgi:hypothetical protein
MFQSLIYCVLQSVLLTGPVSGSTRIACGKKSLCFPSTRSQVNKYLCVTRPCGIISVISWDLGTQYALRCRTLIFGAMTGLIGSWSYIGRDCCRSNTKVLQQTSRRSACCLNHSVWMICGTRTSLRTSCLVYIPLESNDQCGCDGIAWYSTVVPV